MYHKKIIWCPAILFLISSVQNGYAQVSVIQDELIKVSGITTDTQIYSLTPAQKQTTIRFYDGMNRPIQNVAVNATPLLSNIIQPVIYDNLGRLTKVFQPFTDTVSGGYRSSAITSQAAFYNNTSQYLIATDTGAYSQQVFENSPLQRLLRAGSIGGGFQPMTGQHYKTVNYRYNQSGDGSILIWSPDGTYTSGNNYTVNALSVADGIDEDGHEILTFTDIEGHLILKRQMLGTTKLDTYYLYNNAGVVSYVIPPAAVSILGANSNNLNASVIVRQIFKFTYDSRGRVVVKKVPVKGLMYIIYDPLNRPVLLQDSNLMVNHKWNYIRYDVKGRAISQGIYTDNTHTTPAAMQTYVSGLSYSTWYESRSTTQSTGYYTQSVFPTSATGTVTPLAYAYFDNYDLNHDGTADYYYKVQGLTFTSPEGVPITEDSVTTAPVKGVPTMVRTATIGAGSAKWLLKVIFYDKRGNPIQTQSNNQIQFTTDTITDYATSVPDFVGKPQVTLVSKKTGSATANTNTIKTIFTYDGTNSRISFIDQQYNSQANIRTAAYSYNELGQLINKGLGLLSTAVIPQTLTLNTTYTGTNNFVASSTITMSPGFSAPSGAVFSAKIGTNYLQAVDYRYNIRGQLTTINNSTLTNDGQTNNSNNAAFGMQILYDQVDASLGNTAYYNGKISATKWMTTNSTGVKGNERSYKYSYDGIDRYTAATYAERVTAGTGSFSNNVSGFDEHSIAYDANGNIIALSRNSSTQGTNSHTQIDSLAYTYSTSFPGRLSKVVDISGNAAGFDNITASTDTNKYDGNGNLVADPYKGITITYNVLNRTDKINLIAGSGGAPITGDSLRYTYDSNGSVIEKQQYTAGGLTSTTDYIDGFTYTNDTLAYLPMPEGRVTYKGGTLSPEYVITDQQDNARISVKDDGTGHATVIQEDSYYGSGLLMANSQIPTPTLMNKNLYNGGSELQNEYNNVLNYYQTGYRNYDPAIMRFVGVDPSPESAESMTPYQYAYDNPIMFNDPMGDIPPNRRAPQRETGWEADYAWLIDGGAAPPPGYQSYDGGWDSGGWGASMPGIITGKYASFWNAISAGVANLTDGTSSLNADELNVLRGIVNTPDYMASNVVGTDSYGNADMDDIIMHVNDGLNADYIVGSGGKLVFIGNDERQNGKDSEGNDATPWWLPQVNIVSTIAITDAGGQCQTCLIPSTAHQNLYNTNYTGKNNPTSYNSKENYSLPPTNRADFGSMIHDKRYESYGAVGPISVMTDSRTIRADYEFIGYELDLGINSYNGATFTERWQGLANGSAMFLLTLPKTVGYSFGKIQVNPINY